MGQYDKWKSILVSSFDQSMSTLGAYLPSLVGAIMLLLVGIVTAWICRWMILRLGQGLDQMSRKFSFGSAHLHLRWPVSRIISGIVYWVIILFFITAAAESLGLPGLAEWLGKVIVYLPSLFVALLIVWFGFVLGTVVRDKVSSTASANELQHAEELGAAARIVVVTLTIVIGLSQIGVHINLIEELVVVIAAAVVIALALAFGLGAGPAMMNIIAIGSLKQRYKIGDRIKIDTVEGVILSFTRTSVILELENGEAMVPAKVFQDKASFLYGTQPSANDA